jgi:dsDNA-specific endonuclease/ATPase MutS2
MNPRFYVSQFRNLEVEMDGEREILIAPNFMQNENKDKAAEYLRKVANELNRLYAEDPDAAGALMEEAETKIRKAQTAEKFMEEVSF